MRDRENPSGATSILPEPVRTASLAHGLEAAGTLCRAIEAGDLTSVNDLIGSGVEVNGIAPGGLMPLLVASGLGRTQIVKALLAAGAQAHAVEPRAGATALHADGIPRPVLGGGL